MERFLEVVYFPSNAFVKTENLEEGFLRNFFSNFAFPVIGKYDLVFIQISCRKSDQVEESGRAL